VTERLVDDLRADRIVFGSNFYTRPLLYEHLTSLFQIRNADISDRERQLILENNIWELFEL
jgi:predicted TIM-barrel fold metal-dependent hydrolase